MPTIINMIVSNINAIGIDVIIPKNTHLPIWRFSGLATVTAKEIINIKEITTIISVRLLKI